MPTLSHFYTDFDSSIYPIYTSFYLHTGNHLGIYHFSINLFHTEVIPVDDKRFVGNPFEDRCRAYYVFSLLHASIEHSLIFVLLEKSEPPIPTLLRESEKKEIRVFMDWFSSLFTTLLDLCKTLQNNAGKDDNYDFPFEVYTLFRILYNFNNRCIFFRSGFKTYIMLSLLSFGGFHLLAVLLAVCQVAK